MGVGVTRWAATLKWWDVVDKVDEIEEDALGIGRGLHCLELRFFAMPACAWLTPRAIWPGSTTRAFAGRASNEMLRIASERMVKR